MDRIEDYQFKMCLLGDAKLRRFVQFLLIPAEDLDTHMRLHPSYFFIYEFIIKEEARITRFDVWDFVGKSDEIPALFFENALGYFSIFSMNDRSSYQRALKWRDEFLKITQRSVEAGLLIGVIAPPLEQEVSPVEIEKYAAANGLQWVVIPQDDLIMGPRFNVAVREKALNVAKTLRDALKGFPKQSSVASLSGIEPPQVDDSETPLAAMQRQILSELETAIGKPIRNFQGYPQMVGYLADQGIISFLWLQQCGLIKLPRPLFQLKDLKMLNASHNVITTLDESLVQLDQLQILELDENELRSLPPYLRDLHLLETLSLVKNQLTTLPPEFGELSSLKKVYLEINPLEILPDTIGHLQSLESLHLNRNKLITLPESLGNLNSLKSLSLEQNQLTALPDSFGNLHHLKLLYLQLNQLSRLPASFRNLESLEDLILNDNPLTDFPEEILGLKHLQVLSLHNSHITALPDEIGTLHELTNLDLSYNQLTSLPPSLLDLPHLRVLRAHGNPLRSEGLTVLRLLAEKGVHG